MKTYCTYKGEKHEVICFGERLDSYMKEYLCMNKFYVDTKDPYKRYTRVDLVECTDFRQE